MGATTSLVSQIDLLDPDGDAIARQWFAARENARRHDLGEHYLPDSLDVLRAELRLRTSARGETHMALLDERPVGTVTLWFPLRENRNQVFGELLVEPGMRDRGIGSELLAHLTARAEADGRHLVTFEFSHALNRPDAATGFATRHGFTEALTEHRLDLALPRGGADLDAHLGAIEAEAAAAGPAGDYRLLSYTGKVPPEFVAARAELIGRMSTDAPLGELRYEAEQWDGDRLAEGDRVLAAQQATRVETLVVERATGRAVGVTELVVFGHDPATGHQWETIVLPHHRGRRLGMRLKAANLRALLAAEPRIRQVTTWTADVNAPMLRVNRAIGFRPVARGAEWQRDLNAAGSATS